MSKPAPVENPGIFPPPPRVTPNYYHGEQRASGLYPLIGILTFLSAVFFFARPYTKIWIIKVFGWEDVAVTVGWMCTMTFSMLFILLLHTGGQGRIWNMRIDQFGLQLLFPEISSYNSCLHHWLRLHHETIIIHIRL